MMLSIWMQTNTSLFMNHFENKKFAPFLQFINLTMLFLLLFFFVHHTLTAIVWQDPFDNVSNNFDAINNPAAIGLSAITVDDVLQYRQAVVRDSALCCSTANTNLFVFTSVGQQRTLDGTVSMVVRLDR